MDRIKTVRLTDGDGPQFADIVVRDGKILGFLRLYKGSPLTIWDAEVSFTSVPYTSIAEETPSLELVHHNHDTRVYGIGQVLPFVPQHDMGYGVRATIVEPLEGYASQGVTAVTDQGGTNANVASTPQRTDSSITPQRANPVRVRQRRSQPTTPRVKTGGVEGLSYVPPQMTDNNGNVLPAPQVGDIPHNYQSYQSYLTPRTESDKYIRRREYFGIVNKEELNFVRKDHTSVGPDPAVKVWTLGKTEKRTDTSILKVYLHKTHPTVVQEIEYKGEQGTDKIKRSNSIQSTDYHEIGSKEMRAAAAAAAANATKAAIETVQAVEHVMAAGEVEADSSGVVEGGSLVPSGETGSGDVGMTDFDSDEFEYMSGHDL